MELQHSFTVPLPVPEAWEAFNDLERIAPCFPGAQVTSVDGDDFTGVAKIKLGPISLQYSGTGSFVERDEAGRRAVIEASGKDKRGNGTAAARITARLEAEGEGTRCTVDTDLKITGRPAQFGRGVISDVGDKLLGQFATCLSETLGQAAEPAEAEAEEPPVEVAPAPAERAAPAVPAEAPVEQAPAGAEVPAAEVPTAVPSTPPPRPLVPPAARRTPEELDLGAVVGPALARRFGPVLLACTVTALITWWLARRRR